MIAHVAEAGEERGRVVLRLGPTGSMSDIALEAAVRVAQAFQSEIESLFIEDQRLFDLASFPFAREVSLSGRQTRAISAEDIARELRALSAALNRKVAETARRAEVPVRFRSIRDEPVHALAAACTESGPWNVVALAEPLTSGGAGYLAELFAAVEGATGFVLVGPAARRTNGPVVAVIEDVVRVAPMLRAAERLASVTGGDARLLLAGDDGERLHLMEGQVRLMLAEAAAKPLIAGSVRSDPAAILSALRRLGAGFAIVQFGGCLARREAGFSPLAAALEGPLFLVR